MRAFIPLISAACIILLSACSNAPKHPEPAALFTTNISDNGSKFFVYSLERHDTQGKRPQGGREGGREMGSRPPKGEKRGGGGKSFNLEKNLQALLDNNGYCREGYMVLERQQRSIRGECHETATNKDRERFVNPKHVND